MNKFNGVSLPSTFNGITFRSRLEARVAVFLNSIKARYEYEYEGFNLNGRCYLPDFWLPDTFRRSSRKKGVWLEVKPNADESDRVFRNTS